MPPITIDTNTIFYLIMGPFGGLIILFLAVKWLISLFEKEQKKREEAYLTVISMYQKQLDRSDERQDLLYTHMNSLSEYIRTLVEQNCGLLTKINQLVSYLDEQAKKEA